MKYLYQVGKNDNSNESPIYRSPLAKDKGLNTIPADMTSVYHLLKEACDKYKNLESYGFREVEKVIVEEKEVVDKSGDKVTKKWEFPQKSKFQFISYHQLLCQVHYLNAALSHYGFNKEQDKILFYAPPSVEWSTLAHACFSKGIQIITVYDTLGIEGLKHAIEETSSTTIFTTSINIEKVLKTGIDVKNIIYTDKYDKNDLTKVHFFPFQDLIEVGKANSVSISEVQVDDIACIMYTSGSTGKPKGALITHGNLIAPVMGSKLVNEDSFEVGETLASILPLSHIMGFILDIYGLSSGFRIGYCGPRTMVDSTVRNCKGDLSELQPTILMGVPQVYDSIRKGIKQKIKASPRAARFVFKSALYFQSQHLKKTQGKRSTFWDKLVFKKIQQVTGGKLRYCCSGGAPLSIKTNKFFETSICPILQGYGLTETCGLAVTSTVELKDNKRKVGILVPQNELKLIDYSEAGYLHTNRDPQGEICFRGLSVVKGYLKNEEATKEAFDQDGWFHTGDIGQINHDGSISIIDRKKNLVKLSNGEYVAVEKLESIYKNSIYVINVCVIANPLNRSVYAIVVPNIQAINQAIPNKCSDDLEDVKGNKQVKDFVLRNLLSYAKSEGLKGTELISDVYVCNEEWLVDNDLITPAQKLKRKDIETRYKEEIKKIEKAMQ